jgi:hypothetical protein
VFNQLEIFRYLLTFPSININQLDSSVSLCVLDRDLFEFFLVSSSFRNIRLFTGRVVSEEKKWWSCYYREMMLILRLSIM